MLFLDSHRYTLCCECVNDEFIYITPLSVFGTVFVGTGALVSNIVLLDDGVHVGGQLPNLVHECRLEELRRALELLS